MNILSLSMLNIGKLLESALKVVEREGKCTYCSESITTKKDSNLLEPIWECTNYGCSYSISGQTTSWPEILAAFFDKPMTLTLFRQDELPVMGELILSIEVDCPVCSGKYSECETCHDDNMYLVFTVVIPTNGRPKPEARSVPNSSRRIVMNCTNCGVDMSANITKHCVGEFEIQTVEGFSDNIVPIGHYEVVAIICPECGNRMEEEELMRGSEDMPVLSKCCDKPTVIARTEDELVSVCMGCKKIISKMSRDVLVGGTRVPNTMVVGEEKIFRMYSTYEEVCEPDYQTTEMQETS